MARFNEIVEKVQAGSPSANLAVLQKAYVYTAKAHQGQSRLSGEPYLIHPLAVADILAEMRLDEVTVAAGLLHDAIEDTLATQDEIQQEFGDEVAFLVAGLTKISKIEFASREERQAENFRKMLLAMSKDIRIILIKLADRLHNMRTLEYMNEDSSRRIAQETLDIYAPLAHRLGIFWLKQELEERAFKQLYPEMHAEITQKIRGIQKEREEYVQNAIGQLSKILEETGLRVDVTGRAKDAFSLFKKMQAQNVDIGQVYDLIAFRVIVDGTAATCYETLGVVHGAWKPVPGRFKDYIAMPKPNGYQCLHTAVIGPGGTPIEIQIRTPEMHRVAEFGIAAHWKYKQQDADVEDSEERQFAWLRQLLEWQQQLDDPNEFLEAVRVDLFANDVFVFTPRGDVIALPAGATSIDFAYAVHTEIGNHCAGARVNGKLLPLRHRLSNGDIVEVVTSPHQHPRQEWLDHVVTARARSRIRHYLRVQQVEHARTLGAEILRKELKARGANFDKLQKGGQISAAAKELGHKASDAMFAAVAYGKLDPKQVARSLVPGAEAPERGLLQRVLHPLRRSTAVRVDGMDNVLVRFARCCNPLPGEPVVGYITRGRGVTVHARDCSKSFHLDRERKVSVTWEGDSDETRLVRLRVVSEDRPGILAEISTRISAEGINIHGARISTNGKNRAVQNFDLGLRDSRHLHAIVKSISKIRGVLSVERVRR
jgi:GTP pyrophosphokinase